MTHREHFFIQLFHLLQAGAIKNAAVGTTIQAGTFAHTAGRTRLFLSPSLICFSLCLSATVGGNVIVNTVAGVPPSPFQANKRLASPVIPGSLSVSHLSDSVALLHINSVSG